MGPTDFGASFKHLKRSRNGDLIVEFTDQNSGDDVRKVRDRLVNMGLDEIGKVVTLGRQDRIIILDIDPSSDEKEVLDALRAAVPEGHEDSVRVTGLRQTRSGCALASATVPRGFSLSTRSIKIGLFKCRVRQSTPPIPRCYRCHDHGHIARDCGGPDLRGTCLRCASGAHSTNHCTSGEEKCVACDRWGLPPLQHKPGSAQCGIRIRALGPSTLRNHHDFGRSGQS